MIWYKQESLISDIGANKKLNTLADNFLNTNKKQNAKDGK